ncbi:hypothetical protein V6N11_058858 [Hibiscus sabdariffa]|uniref:Uncharacterized protein n=1 Tax=Hibiscus sabdariffa TaxID=183260 RepID=A0ABR2U5E6_9ROSI
MSLAEKQDNNAIQADKLDNLTDTQNDLFGPWMLVENRRRRVLPESRSIMGKHKGERIVTGSRYKVLDVNYTVEGGSATAIGATEPASVPAKAPAVMKPSKKGGSTGRAVLVPSIAGLDAMVEEHDPKVVKGVHKAVKIIENRSGGPSTSHGVGIKARIVNGKSRKEDAQRGLRVRKSSGSKLGDRMALAELASSFANQFSEPPGAMGS